jgi:hypothetical protein
MSLFASPRLTRAADALVQLQFAVKPGESVLVTADTNTEARLIDTVAAAVSRAGAKLHLAIAPQLPFQGALSDRYVPDSLKAAAIASDVWLDFCFPYHAGSGAHGAAMDAGRCRYALLAIAQADSFDRLYGCVDFAAMIELNVALSELFAAAAGERARFTCPRGTDMSFTLDQLKSVRPRVSDRPGMYAVPGTQGAYPVKESVKGTLVIQALFDEYYRLLREPITITADGKIAGFTGGGAEDRPSFARALRRASSDGDYGYFIHFTLGFHPGTMLTGRSFIEDIRIPGSNAIGMGLPWWEKGGGENHPDGIVFDQSFWIGDLQIVECGAVIGPANIKALHDRMSRQLD